MDADNVPVTEGHMLAAGTQNGVVELYARTRELSSQATSYRVVVAKGRRGGAWARGRSAGAWLAPNMGLRGGRSGNRHFHNAVSAQSRFGEQQRGAWMGGLFRSAPGVYGA